MVAAREAWISRLPNITPFFWYASSAGNWALVSGITWKAVSKNRVIAEPGWCSGRRRPHRSARCPPPPAAWLPSLSTTTTSTLGRNMAL
jgi:hypothetical protein